MRGTIDAFKPPAIETVQMRGNSKILSLRFWHIISLEETITMDDQWSLPFYRPKWNNKQELERATNNLLDAINQFTNQAYYEFMADEAGFPNLCILKDLSSDVSTLRYMLNRLLNTFVP